VPPVVLVETAIVVAKRIEWVGIEAGVVVGVVRDRLGESVGDLPRAAPYTAPHLRLQRVVARIGQRVDQRDRRELRIRTRIGCERPAWRQIGVTASLEILLPLMDQIDLDRCIAGEQLGDPDRRTVHVGKAEIVAG
jgi:hypothetical protein